MLERFSTILTHTKSSNTWNLLNEILQVIYSLHRAKKIIAKVYNKIMNSIKLSYKIDTIFMNSEKK